MYDMYDMHLRVFFYRAYCKPDGEMEKVDGRRASRKVSVEVRR
jgi:hypothetical protein